MIKCRPLSLRCSRSGVIAFHGTPATFPWQQVRGLTGLTSLGSRDDQSDAIPAREIRATFLSLDGFDFCAFCFISLNDVYSFVFTLNYCFKLCYDMTLFLITWFFSNFFKINYSLKVIVKNTIVLYTSNVSQF